MSENEKQDSTIQYYNKNAVEFVNRTADIDMTKIYPKFTHLLPGGGKSRCWLWLRSRCEIFS